MAKSKKKKMELICAQCSHKNECIKKFTKVTKYNNNNSNWDYVFQTLPTSLNMVTSFWGINAFSNTPLIYPVISMIIVSTVYSVAFLIKIKNTRHK